MSDEFVTITEVGPRDGLQNEKTILSLEDKLTYIGLLAAAGLPEIEAGAFVSPKWVPQMADSADVFREIAARKIKGPVFSALVPNEQGFEAAQKSRVKKIAVFTAASETFSQKNTNCSILESLDRFLPVFNAADLSGVAVRAYVSTAFVCPYEGEIAPEQVLAVVNALDDLGVSVISIGDTVGRATENQVERLLEALLEYHPPERFALHFHDTSGHAIEHVALALEYGFRSFDASAGGVGGCPYAPGAAGNLATEKLVAFLHSEGLVTGVDEAKLAAAATFIQKILGR